MHIRHASIAAVSAAAFALVALTGCSGMTDVVEQVHSESFDTRAAAAEGWVGVPMPAWLPEDATDIRTTATNKESNAVIAYVGSAPVDCTRDARSGLPFDGRYGGFTDASELPAEVLWCGSYEVHETPEGWLAWYNATEAGETPTR